MESALDQQLDTRLFVDLVYMIGEEEENKNGRLSRRPQRKLILFLEALPATVSLRVSGANSEEAESSSARPSCTFLLQSLGMKMLYCWDVMIHLHRMG